MDSEEADTDNVPSGYFKSYDDFEVHRLMLEDEPRTYAYKRAIETNDAVKDKVVLDVGAGTGILSLFCAKAGAKKVYAVEASDMAKTLKDVISKNGCENIVQVIHGRIEEVEILEEVDVIVSEWMGFYLLHESMLDSVVFARDKYLRKDQKGMMLPSKAKIYTAPCSMEEHWKDKAQFWNDVYGFDMSPFGIDMIKREKMARGKPEIMCLNPSQILSDPQIFAELDLLTITNADLNSLSKKHFGSIKQNGKYHGTALWFDCEFYSANHNISPKSSVILDTGPWNKPTHWKQTVIITASGFQSDTDCDDDTCLVEEDEVIGWQIQLERSKIINGSTVNGTNRHYTISVGPLDPVSESHPTGCKCMLAKCALMQALLEDENSLDGEEIWDIT